jgi:hypothetical protein
VGRLDLNCPSCKPEARAGWSMPSRRSLLGEQEQLYRERTRRAPASPGPRLTVLAHPSIHRILPTSLPLPLLESSTLSTQDEPKHSSTPLFLPSPRPSPSLHSFSPCSLRVVFRTLVNRGCLLACCFTELGALAPAASTDPHRLQLHHRPLPASALTLLLFLLLLNRDSAARGHRSRDGESLEHRPA